MALFSGTWELFVNMLFNSGPELALFLMRYPLMTVCSASWAKETGYGYALQDSLNVSWEKVQTTVMFCMENVTSGF